MTKLCEAVGNLVFFSDRMGKSTRQGAWASLNAIPKISSVLDENLRVAFKGFTRIAKLLKRNSQLLLCMSIILKNFKSENNQ
jgi:hypothetical protein